jgi:hypothetical protein
MEPTGNNTVYVQNAEAPRGYDHPCISSLCLLEGREPTAGQVSSPSQPRNLWFRLRSSSVSRIDGDNDTYARAHAHAHSPTHADTLAD